MSDGKVSSPTNGDLNFDLLTFFLETVSLLNTFPVPVGCQDMIDNINGFAQGLTEIGIHYLDKGK